MSDGTELRWSPSGRHVATGLLAAEAVLAAAFAIWPPVPTDRALNAALALPPLLAAIGGAVTWRRRGTLVSLEAMLVVAWIVPAVVIATRKTEASQLLWASVMVMTVVLVAFYLPARHAAWHVPCIIAAYLLASLAFDPPTRLLFAGAFAVIMALAAVAVMQLRRDRDRILASVSSLATTDPLTGLLNRRGLDAEAGIVHANARRAGRPTIVAVIDLDGLKRLNDTHGHEAGDAFITGTADHWRTHLREGDLIARTGGDEFVIVLPMVDEATAAHLLTRIRDTNEGSWSQGWTEWADDEALDEAVERADALMYAEKARRRAGRDD